MDRLQVKDLKKDLLVTLQNFMVSDLKVSKTKAGKEYISFKVSDKTGSMAAVWWEYGTQPPPIQSLLKNGVMQVGGTVDSYNNVLQLKVEGIAPATPHNLSDYEKCSKYDPEKMWTEFMGFVSEFQNPHVLRVAQNLVNRFGDQFKVCAAATGMHHAFKHGLLEHTLQMLQSGDALLQLPCYNEVLDRDMCMFGLMFHDFGKIFEYGPPPDFKRTAEGCKVPHIPALAIEIGVECREYKIPIAVEREMESIILSHHRQIAWGSPVSFSSAEAAFVHYIDNLHGDVFGIVQRVESDTTSDATVKQGYGSDAYTIVKKSPGQVLKENQDEYAGF